MDVGVVPTSFPSMKTLAPAGLESTLSGALPAPIAAGADVLAGALAAVGSRCRPGDDDLVAFFAVVSGPSTARLDSVNVRAASSFPGAGSFTALSVNSRPGGAAATAAGADAVGTTAATGGAALRPPTT